MSVIAEALPKSVQPWPPKSGSATAPGQLVTVHPAGSEERYRTLYWRVAVAGEPGASDKRNDALSPWPLSCGDDGEKLGLSRQRLVYTGGLYIAPRIYRTRTTAHKSRGFAGVRAMGPGAVPNASQPLATAGAGKREAKTAAGHPAGVQPGGRVARYTTLYCRRVSGVGAAATFSKNLFAKKSTVREGRAGAAGAAAAPA